MVLSGDKYCIYQLFYVLNHICLPSNKSVVSTDLCIIFLVLMGWTTRVQFPAGAVNFSPDHVQTGSGAQPASYIMGTKGSFPRVRVARA
jgi:hypothetical protein